jgi:hypothetical protein
MGKNENHKSQTQHFLLEIYKMNLNSQTKGQKSADKEVKDKK